MVWERRDETMSQCMFFWFVVVVVSCMNNSTGGSSRPVANCLDTTFWVVHLFQTPLSHHHHLIISAGAFTHYTDDDSTLLKSSSTAWLSFLFRLGENCCLLPACTCVSSLPLFLSFFLHVWKHTCWIEWKGVSSSSSSSTSSQLIEIGRLHPPVRHSTKSFHSAMRWWLS